MMFVIHPLGHRDMVKSLVMASHSRRGGGPARLEFGVLQEPIHIWLDLVQDRGRWVLNPKKVLLIRRFKFEDKDAARGRFSNAME